MSAYRINPDSNGCTIDDAERGTTIWELWHVTGLPVGSPWKFKEEIELPSRGDRHPVYPDALVRNRRLVEFWNEDGAEAHAKVLVIYSSIAAWGAAFNRNSRGGTRFDDEKIPVFQRFTFGTPPQTVYDWAPDVRHRAVATRVERRNLGAYNVGDLEAISGRAVGFTYQLDGDNPTRWPYVGMTYFKTPGNATIVDYLFELPRAYKRFIVGSELKNDVEIPACPAGFRYAINRTVSPPDISVYRPDEPDGTRPSLPQL